MKPIYANLAGALALTTGIAACVPAPRPTPVPTVVTPRPVSKSAPVAAPTFANWLDAPQTSGDWSYRSQPNGGVAEFGNGTVTSFRLRCDAAARSVVLTRLGVPTGPQQMTVRTESQTRTLGVIASPLTVSAQLSANDRLLDAIALSKGRFAVEVAGAPTLYLPSWAEVTRVIEDCR